jgi:hypothetical protein
MRIALLHLEKLLQIDNMSKLKMSKLLKIQKNCPNFKKGSKNERR